MDKAKSRAKLMAILRAYDVQEHQLGGWSFTGSKLYVSLNTKVNEETKHCLVCDIEKAFPGYEICLRTF